MTRIDPAIDGDPRSEPAGDEPQSRSGLDQLN
jgi:hypothetical protein